MDLKAWKGVSLKWVHREVAVVARMSEFAVVVGSNSTTGRMKGIFIDSEVDSRDHGDLTENLP